MDLQGMYSAPNRRSMLHALLTAERHEPVIGMAWPTYGTVMMYAGYRIYGVCGHAASPNCHPIVLI